MPNVFGHKDIMSTTCPGAYLYAQLNTVRKLAHELQVKSSKKKFVKDYDYIDNSKLYYLELKPWEEKTVVFKLENIGKKAWTSKTFIVMNRNADAYKMLNLPKIGNMVAVKMVEKSVRSGGTATFKVKIKAKDKGEQVTLKFAPMFNGTKKSRDYITLPVAIEQADFKYKFISSVDAPKTMKAGEKATVLVKLKNTGNMTWRKNGNNVVRLGTDHQRDRTSRFVKPASTRIGFLKENEVRPGETGTFEIKITAPKEAGFFQEYYTPVVEGKTWMKDSGLSFSTTVWGGDDAGQVVSVVENPQWAKEKKYFVRTKIRNLGETTWTKKNFRLMTMKESKLNISGINLANAPVEPGEVATIDFVAKVSSSSKLGKKSLIIRPTIEGRQIMKPIYIRYNVVEKNTNQIKTDVVQKTSLKPSGGDIRVKIGFNGDPEITASGDFNVISRGKTLLRLSKYDKVKISYSAGKYKIKIGGKTISSNGYLTFKPKGASILEIANFEHHPAWNKSLNDNEYRGELEVRRLGGKLTVVNELPLEWYLRGLGEVSNGSQYEKIKAVIVSARTYAKYYMDVKRKFPNMPYNLDDDPNTSQRYLGYGFEKRAYKVVKAIEETAGEVVTYNGKLVKTPYFSQSDGTYTKSAKDVWGWTDTPYLKSVSDSYCTGDEFLGHGVGLSGCGAEGMAKVGKTYKEILRHYFSGVKITKLY